MNTFSSHPIKFKFYTKNLFFLLKNNLLILKPFLNVTNSYSIFKITIFNVFVRLNHSTKNHFSQQAGVLFYLNL